MSAVMDPFRSLFATCPEMLLVAGQDGEILHANEALVQTLGPIGERTSLLDLAHPEDRDLVAVSWRRLRAGEPSVELTCRWKGAGGSDELFACSFWALPQREEIGGALRPAAAVGGAGPVQGARRSLRWPGAPAELGRNVPGVSQGVVLHSLLYNLPLVMWILDRGGRYLFSEGKGLERVGLVPGLVVGRHIDEFSPGASGPGTPIARAMAGESLHEISHHVGRWWESWHIPLRDERGEIPCMAGISLDVTEAKRGEQELLAKVELIERQQEVIREIGVPIIEVGEGVLALPVIGVVDTRRAAEMRDALLDRVAGRRARYAILDLTGAGAVDSATATHLLSLTRAVRLLGAEGVITGIRPSVAQTLATLGLDLAEIITLANLREGIRYCIARSRKHAAAS